MPNSIITDLNHELLGAFEGNADRRAAHRAAQRIMSRVVTEKKFRDALITQCLNSPTFMLQKRINPVIALPVFENQHFTLVANVWFPLPNESTEETHQSIHHHGNLLLSSVAGFGSGYESILFERNFEMDSKTRVTQMRIAKIYENPMGNVEFVDSYTPHVVFYPKELSVTIALWSSERATAASGLRKGRIFQKSKKWIRKGLDALHLTSTIGLNQTTDLDFFPQDGQILCLQNRVMYPVGSEENFRKNFFHLLQAFEYSDLGHIKASLKNLPENEQKTSLTWLKKLESGEVIPREFEKAHLEIPKINLKRDEILRCFPKMAAVS